MPYLQVAISTTTDQSTIAVSNQGLGPALIRTFGLKLDDSLVNSWQEVLHKLNVRPTAQMGLASIYPGQVIPAGASRGLLSLEKHPAGSQLAKQINRLQVEICYCSLYAECWEIAFRGTGGPDKRECRQRSARAFTLPLEDSMLFVDTVLLVDTVFIQDTVAR
jgi:hypothetical protein